MPKVNREVEREIAVKEMAALVADVKDKHGPKPEG